MKKKILFIGDNPLTLTGNGNMLGAIIDQIDFEEYQVAVIGTNLQTPIVNDIFKQIPFVNIQIDSQDVDGFNRILATIQTYKTDILFFVGTDIWVYGPIFSQILAMRERNPFKWVFLFPYDFHYYRREIGDLANMVDVPCVYSQYGYDMLSPHVDKLKYYRPPLRGSDLYKEFSPKEKKEARRKRFSVITPNNFIFGFVGANQIRKDPQKIIKAFLQAKEVGFENKGVNLYFHTNMQNGIYNLIQYSQENGAVTGDFITRGSDTPVFTDTMVEIYNSLDCLVNVSQQEGLSWTLIEAMLCGVPVIASYNTAQIELLNDAEGNPTVGLPVNTNISTYLRIKTVTGESWVDTKMCSAADLRGAMLLMESRPDLRRGYIAAGKLKAKEWLAGVTDINTFLAENAQIEAMEAKRRQKNMEAVLFVQHSSAGDVLMSTQCFKGIKEIHKLPIHYMTQRVFKDIIEGNPYIDEILDWDTNLIDTYGIIYDPHGKKILPGGWNNLDVRLHDMYPYFCRVEADSMFIGRKKPVDIPEYDLMGVVGGEDITPYIVVHTTGGSTYRRYTHMDKVIKGFKHKYTIIQIGIGSDAPCSLADIDLRGKTTWRETAYVMHFAKAAVVIDSFPSHLAGYEGTPVIVLYGPAPARVTGPKGDPDKIVNIEPDMLEVCPISSHCWGDPPSGKKACNTPCINSISPFKIKKELNNLLERCYPE